MTNFDQEVKRIKSELGDIGCKAMFGKTCKEVVKEICMKVKDKGDVKPGDIIHIYHLFGESGYAGREGMVKFIDDMGQIHGTWGGLALLFIDDWEIIG